MIFGFLHSLSFGGQECISYFLGFCTPGVWALGSGFLVFVGFTLPLSKLAGVEIEGFWKMHSLLFLLQECFLKILKISTPFLEKHVSVFCSFWQFPLPLSQKQRVAFTKTSFLHSLLPESGE